MGYGFGQVHATAATDIGLRRAVNEDAVLEAGTIFAVADGMGGHEAGDLASRLGIAALAELADTVGNAGNAGTNSGSPGTLPHASDVLARVTAADESIRRAIGARGGTTLCALALVRMEQNGGTWPAAGDHAPESSPGQGTHPAPSTDVLRLPMPALGEPRYLPGTDEAHQAAHASTPPTPGPDEEPISDPAPTDHPEPTTDVLPRAELEAALAEPAPVPPVTATSAKVTPIPGAQAPEAPAPATTPTATTAPTGQVRLMLLNVGDSRGYRLRNGVLTQLTRDHSAVQELLDAGIINEAEARIHPQRNLITRALGAGGNAVPDTQFHIPRPGDRYLLCTDGLTGEVEHSAMEQILAHVTDRAEAVAQLIDAALASGGRDNISVIIIDVESP